jgi:hypothetical protein
MMVSFGEDEDNIETLNEMEDFYELHGVTEQDYIDINEIDYNNIIDVEDVVYFDDTDDMDNINDIITDKLVEYENTPSVLKDKFKYNIVNDEDDNNIVNEVETNNVNNTNYNNISDDTELYDTIDIVDYYNIGTADEMDNIRYQYNHREKPKTYNYMKYYRINSNCENENINQSINSYKDNLTKIHRLNMHTYTNDTPVYDEFYTHINKKSKEKEYSNNYINKSCVHIGQLKLLHSEIKLIEQTLYELWGEGRLSMKGKKYGECDRPIVVIAPGGAAGHHFMHSTILLPTIKFELYDPNPFDEQLVEHPNISTFSGYFTDDTAKMLKDKYSKDHVIIIVSDIRTADHKNSSKDKVEEDVYNDMKMQDRWFRIINPDFCIYKFRTEYNYNQEIKPYNGLKGKLYFQVTQPPNSSELRLLARKDCPQHDYDPKRIEKICAYHNRVSRCNLYYHGYESNGNSSYDVKTILSNRNVEEFDKIKPDSSKRINTDLGLCSCYDCRGLVDMAAFHISLSKQKFPIVNNKFKNIIELLEWLLPPYIDIPKLLLLNKINIAASYRNPHIINITDYKKVDDKQILQLCKDTINLLE